MPDIIKMKYFSLFSGIGGFERGIQRAMPEAKCVGYSEVDKHATEIYERHFPEHRNYGDATRIVPSELPDFDLLVAGFPCQAFSIAGKRRGFQDSRGTLFFEIARICSDKRPGYILLENVKGLLSSKTDVTPIVMKNLLAREIVKENGIWERKFIPLNNWNILSENISVYLAEIWHRNSDYQRQVSDISSIKDSVLAYGKLECYLRPGLKRKLKYLKKTLSPIMRKLNCYLPVQLPLFGRKDVDVVSLLEKCITQDNLLVTDISLLEETVSMLSDQDWLPPRFWDVDFDPMNMSITSTETKGMIDPKIYMSLKELSILSFIIKQWRLSNSCWKRILSNLIKKKEGTYYVRTFNVILKTLAEIGYDLQWTVLNSKDFGVPQNRERIFIIGHLRARARPEVFPIGEGCQTLDTEKSTVYCLDANYGKGAARGSRSMIFHENKSGNAAIHTDSTCALRSGGSHNYQTVSFIYAEHQQDRVYQDMMGALPSGTHNNAGQFAKTLVDGKIRRLTPLEWERLQSFPDRWTEGLSDTARYRCLGNAVTVNVIEVIMRKWVAKRSH